jgi:hypothetical protein
MIGDTQTLMQREINTLTALEGLRLFHAGSRKSTGRY